MGFFEGEDLDIQLVLGHLVSEFAWHVYIIAEAYFLQRVFLPPGNCGTFGLNLKIYRSIVHKFHNIIGFSRLPDFAVKFIGFREGSVDSSNGSAFALIDF